MRKALTLVEVLLAVVVSSLLMVAGTTILVDYSELYLLEQTRPSYDQHAGNVAHFLEQTFTNAISQKVTGGGSGGQNQGGQTFRDNNTGIDIKIDTNGGSGVGSGGSGVGSGGSSNGQVSGGSIELAELPEAIGDTEKYLNFENNKHLALLNWEEGGVLPMMRVYLFFEEGEGLFFVWQTMEQKAEDPDEMQISLISPFVKSMRYQYYDAEDDEWEEELSFLDEDEQEVRQIPDMLKLDFEWPDGRTLTSTVILPPNATGAPVY